MSGTYTTAHGDTGSLTHGARPGTEPAPSWFLVGFVSAAPRRDLQGPLFLLLARGELFLDTETTPLTVRTDDSHTQETHAPACLRLGDPHCSPRWTFRKVPALPPMTAADPRVGTKGRARRRQTAASRFHQGSQVSTSCRHLCWCLRHTQPLPRGGHPREKLLKRFLEGTRTAPKL